MDNKDSAYISNQIIPDVSMSVRIARPQDKQAFIDLWKICFEDTDEFIMWFFENRYFPEYSACIEIDGVIVCAMQSMPISLWIRERSIPGAIVVGVCTHPDFRGRHFMKRMFTYYMQQMEQKSLIAITYKPENIKTYFSLGHYPVTRTIHYEVDNVTDNYIKIFEASSILNNSSMTNDNNNDNNNSNFSSFKINDVNISNINISIYPIIQVSSCDLNMCFDLYASISSSYSGMINRDKDLFVLKSQDYASVGGKLLLFNKLETLTGYCFYFETENEIYGEELIASDYGTVFGIVNKLLVIARNKALKVKIPPNFMKILDSNINRIFSSENPAMDANENKTDPSLISTKSNEFEHTDTDTDNNVHVYISPQNVLGVTQISEFIKLLDLGRFNDIGVHEQIVVEIKDDILEENNIKVNLAGEISYSEPCITIGIGYFVQVLCGYTSINNLLAEYLPDEQIEYNSVVKTVEPYNNSGNLLKNKKPITIHDDIKAKEIDKLLSQCECFIIDEY